jgi:aminoglycoside 3-N-acetyltransferase
VAENVTRPRIVKDLQALGVKRGDVLAVHSSLKSIGFVDGGAETVIAALKEAVGPSGTIIMPVFSKPVDIFVARDEPSHTGTVTETFRKLDGTLRSLHPTHSVAAWGKHAHSIVREHQLHQALGVNSPFHRLAKRGGKVLMIGVPYTRASIVHVAESIARVPYQDVFYPGYKRETMVIAANGKRFKYTPRDNPGDSSAFGVVEEFMKSEGKLTQGRIGSASCTIALGIDIIKASLALMSKDGAAMLCRNPECAVCPRRRAIVARLRWRCKA